VKDAKLMAKQPHISLQDCKAFEESANPHQWFLTASSLHDQAVKLYRMRNSGGVLTQLDSMDNVVATHFNMNKATFLLCAFALENAIKSFIVFEHPEFVANGSLHKELCSHKLVLLSEKSTLIPCKKRNEKILAQFEDGNDGWMRYPCGRRASDIQLERDLADKLWNGYERAMSGYGKALVRLFKKGWTGPHGFSGHWIVKGSWL
jgi:hypothetical protein